MSLNDRAEIPESPLSRLILDADSSCAGSPSLHEDEWQALILSLETALAWADRANAKYSHGAVHGELHPYPQSNGRIYYNYYPHEIECPSNGKEKRRYVPLKEVSEVRANIEKGRRVLCIQDVQAHVYHLIKQLEAFDSLPDVPEKAHSATGADLTTEGQLISVEDRLQELKLEYSTEGQLISVKDRLQELELEYCWSSVFTEVVKLSQAEISRRAFSNYCARRGEKPPRRTTVGETKQRFQVYHYPLADVDCIDSAVEFVTGRAKEVWSVVGSTIFL